MNRLALTLTAVVATVAIAVAATVAVVWVSATRVNDTGSPAGSVTMAFGADDLDGFLLSQAEVDSLSDYGIPLGQPVSTYSWHVDAGHHPGCGLYLLSPRFPAGFRHQSGDSTQIAQWGHPVLSFRQDVIQFSTPEAAAQAYELLSDPKSHCFQYTTDHRSDEEGMLLTSSMGHSTPGRTWGLVRVDGVYGDRSTWATALHHNVVVIAHLYGFWDREDVYLTQAKAEQIAAVLEARLATLQGHPVEIGTHAEEQSGSEFFTESEIAGAWLIDFDSIGPLTTSMTSSDAFDIIDFGASDYVMDGSIPDSMCGTYFFGGSWTDIAVGGLAASDGAYGVFDVLYLTGYAPDYTLPFYLNTVPRTAEGVTLGTSRTELLATYQGEVEAKPFALQTDYTVVTRKGPGSTAMLFLISPATDAVHSITVGREPMVSWPEGCV